MTANFILDASEEFLCLGAPDIVIQRVPRQAESSHEAKFPVLAGSVTRDFPNLDDFCGNITNGDSHNDDVETCSYDEANIDKSYHSMEITVYQQRILVEYCDLMTSISTVSQGFLFCCIFKISPPVS
jgi:hypothetical protein